MRDVCVERVVQSCERENLEFRHAALRCAGDLLARLGESREAIDIRQSERILDLLLPVFEPLLVLQPTDSATADQPESPEATVSPPTNISLPENQLPSKTEPQKKQPDTPELREQREKDWKLMRAVIDVTGLVWPSTLLTKSFWGTFPII